MLDEDDAIAFEFLKISCPFAFMVIMKAAFMCVPKLKALRSPGRTPFFSVGGKSGWELIYDCYVQPGFQVLFSWFVMMAYNFACAAIMQALETPNEEAERAALVVTMDDFKARLSAADYQSVADSLGYSETGPWRNWDIWGSSYYVFTLVTTVGYGSFGASTVYGQVFTIFCTFFGIPIFAYVSVTTGHALFDLLAGPYFHWLDRHTRILFGNALGDLSPNKQNAYSVQPEKLPNVWLRRKLLDPWVLSNGTHGQVLHLSRASADPEVLRSRLAPIDCVAQGSTEQRPDCWPRDPLLTGATQRVL